MVLFFASHSSKCQKQVDTTLLKWRQVILSLGVILSSRGHLSLPRAVCYWYEWVKAYDVTKHIMLHKTAPDNKELSDPNCQ